MTITRREVLALAAGGPALIVAARAQRSQKSLKSFKPAELFEMTHVWTAHLQFTPDQWAAMEPRYTSDGERSSVSRLQGPEGKRNGLSASRGIEFPYARAHLDFENRPFPNVAVRYKGNGTYSRSSGIKRSLKVDLNEFVKGQKLAKAATLNFHSCVTDASWMNEVLAHRLFRDASLAGPRTAYARVYITAPGHYDRKYFGLFSLVENVDANFTDEFFGKDDGALLKPVIPSLFDDMGDNWAGYNQTYDPKTELTQAQKQRIIECCKVLSKADAKEFAARLGDFVDLDQFAAFMAVTVYLSDTDSILGTGQNYYMYLHPKTHKFLFISWDKDNTFGNSQLSIHQPWRGYNSFLDRVFHVETFKNRYLAKLEEFSKTIFKPERIFQHVDEIAAAIRPAVKEESDYQLTRFEQSVAGQYADQSFGRFGGMRGPIKPFVVARLRSVTEQLGGKMDGAVAGGAGWGGGRFGP